MGPPDVEWTQVCGSFLPAGAMLLLLLSTSLLALDKAVWKIHLSQFHIAIFDALSLHFGRARVLPRIVSTLNFTTKENRLHPARPDFVQNFEVLSPICPACTPPGAQSKHLPATTPRPAQQRISSPKPGTSSQRDEHTRERTRT